MSRDLNKVTQKLLEEGWTKDQTPPGMKPWKEFYGGWEYDFKFRQDCVFETGCGLLCTHREIISSMSYMGIEWTEENDMAITHCPYWHKETCDKNHPYLDGKRIFGGANDCLVHQTNKPYDYEKSTKKIWNEHEAEKEELWQRFQEEHKGRACRQQCRYDMKKGEWIYHYFPEMCALQFCRHCVVLDKDIDMTKFNVFYDLEKKVLIKGEGIIPDEWKMSIEKGKKLFDKPIAKTIAEVLAKVGHDYIQQKEEMRHSTELFFKNVKDIKIKNIRAEKKAGRDLLQDLKDIEAGIAVIHEVDRINDAKKDKKEKREAAAEAKRKRNLKKIEERGWDNLQSFEKRTILKTVDIAEAKEADRKRKEAPEQVSLF